MIHLTKSQIITQKKDSCFYLILSNLKKWCKKLVILGSFLKKTERVNSITLKVAISKNKRARHVIENNRFVLAGQVNKYACKLNGLTSLPVLA